MTYLRGFLEVALAQLPFYLATVQRPDVDQAATRPALSSKFRPLDIQEVDVVILVAVT